jgi:hypothetical protein
VTTGKKKRLHYITKIYKVKSFFRKILKHDRYLPPKKVAKNFNALFNKPLNIEWNKSGDNYEALFHHENIEKIASFNSKGRLNEVRMNQTAEKLPETLYQTAIGFGEIMNVIFIQKEKENHYEIIARKPDLTRMLILINDKNEVLRHEIL